MIFWILPLPFVGKRFTKRERYWKAQKRKEKDGLAVFFCNHPYKKSHGITEVDIVCVAFRPYFWKTQKFVENVAIHQQFAKIKQFGMYKPSMVIPNFYRCFVEAWFGRLTKASLEHSFQKGSFPFDKPRSRLIYLCNLPSHNCDFPALGGQIDQFLLAFWSVVCYSLIADRRVLSHFIACHINSGDLRWLLWVSIRFLSRSATCP